MLATLRRFIFERRAGPLQRVVREERGQIAIAFMLIVIGVFALFGLSFDTGMWYFDHRTAQHQADAAALAAAAMLPSSDVTTATNAANGVLTDNGVSLSALSCMAFSKTGGSTQYNTVKICLRRQSNSFFSSLANIDSAWVSASSTAMAGPAAGSNVMPWAVVAPDPTCGPTAGRDCHSNAKGNEAPGGCDGPFASCPWGLTTQWLYVFKTGGGGDTGPTRVCGQGTSDYDACINGSKQSPPVSAGSQILVKPGNLGVNTLGALAGRDTLHPLAYQTNSGASCDSQSFPSVSTSASDPGGYDPNGVAAAMQAYVTNPTYGDCRYRIVVIPILDDYPTNGNATENVLGLATFAIAGWNRNADQDLYGSATQACGTASNSASNFDCGALWGYLIPGATAPDFALEHIDDDPNPLAPILIALTS